MAIAEEAGTWTLIAFLAAMIPALIGYLVWLVRFNRRQRERLAEWDRLIAMRDQLDEVWLQRQARAAREGK
jgi:hypothetical protein